MEKLDSFVLDLIEDVLGREITIAEVRACIDQVEKSLRDMRTSASDVNVRRKVDAALGLRPWP